MTLTGGVALGKTTPLVADQDPGVLGAPMASVTLPFAPGALSTVSGRKTTSH